jgi:hypothetical protein
MSIDPRYDEFKLDGESPAEFQARMNEYRRDTQLHGDAWKPFYWNGTVARGLPDPFSKLVMQPMPESALRNAENGLMYASHHRSYA